jgi:hypothetical protein
MIVLPSFCGKNQESVLTGMSRSHVSQKYTWPPMIKQGKEPVLGVQGRRIAYNEALFGPSLVEKKGGKQSCLKKSPPSDNLVRDVQDFEAQKADNQIAISREASSSESSRSSTPEHFVVQSSEKKGGKQSGLKKSPPSDNLFRDSNDSGTSSSLAQKTSLLELSRTSVAENSTFVLAPALITIAFQQSHQTEAFSQKVAPLRVIIPEKYLKPEDKPRLIAPKDVPFLIEHSCVPR